MPRKRDSIKYGVRSSSSSPENYIKHGSEGAVGVLLTILSLCIFLPAKVLHFFAGAGRATMRYHRNSK